MKQKKLNAYEKIQAVQKWNERFLLKHIREYELRELHGWKPSALTPKTWWNALERLRKKGRVGHEEWYGYYDLKGRRYVVGALAQKRSHRK